MSKKTGDAELPESVKDEVNAIREQEGLEPQAEPEEAERVEVKPLSRRAQKEQERNEQIKAAEERAAKAAEIAEDLRKKREEDAARLERMERMLQDFGQRAQQPAPVQQRQEPDKDWSETYSKHMKRAKEALVKGDMDEYHERMEKAYLIKAKAEIGADIAKRIPQAAPAMPTKPAWITAVESQFPDVMMHPTGTQAVTAFAALDQTPMSPEKLQRAFTRAREELGLAKRSQETNQAKRQMLAGASTNGTAKTSSGKGEHYVNVPKNYKDIARRAGMSPEDYIRSYAAMNPREVSRD